MTKSFYAVLLTTAGLGALCAGGGIANAAEYMQTDLVSDISGLADITDPNLVNSWGLAHLTNSPFWISDQGTNDATLYSVPFNTATKVPLTVAIPTTVPPVEGPTGLVANGGTGFDVGTTGKSADFIFANLNGSISAWNGSAGTKAVTEVTTAGASFTGLAISHGNTLLYAANGAAGTIDVFNSSFAPVTTLPAGAFATPSPIVKAGLVPFNVEDIGGNVWVTYALAGHPAQTTAALGEGALVEFSESGAFEAMSPASADSHLASPWGLTVAPATFGKFGGDILVGNFSYDHSEINAFNPTTWAFEGTIDINAGAGDTSGGLWSLEFGGGGKDGATGVLYFTDGINGETAGLFGAIESVPEPSTWAMMLFGFGGLAFLAIRRRRAALALG
jgi:uncharacterized protein (TIGR03118 family)